MPLATATARGGGNGGAGAAANETAGASALMVEVCHKHKTIKTRQLRSHRMKSPQDPEL